MLSDVSPNLSGIANVDEARLLELGRSAIELCAKLPQSWFSKVSSEWLASVNDSLRQNRWTQSSST